MTNPMNDGGPAFPQNPEWMSNRSGMTLRDWHAGQALAGLLANPNYHGTISDSARDAYRYADEALAVREKGGG